MRSLKRIVVVLGIVAGLYVALAAGLFFLQGRLIYPAPKSGTEPHMDDAELAEIPGQDGRTVYALYVPAPAGQPTVVHFHGNAEQLADVVPLAWSFRRRKLGFFAVEYPGYGLAGKWEPSEKAIYADAEAALWHLHNGREVAPERVVLQGQSLGSAVAVEMAKRGHGSRLVLISPFTSMSAVAQHKLPILPANWLVTERYDTLSKVDDLSLPVLIIHGGADEVVPVSMGQRLGELLPNASVRVIRDAGHNNLFVRDGEAIVRTIADFSRGELSAP